MTVWPEPRWRPSGWWGAVARTAVYIWLLLAIAMFVVSAAVGLYDLAHQWLPAL